MCHGDTGLFGVSSDVGRSLRRRVNAPGRISWFHDTQASQGAATWHWESAELWVAGYACQRREEFEGTESVSTRHGRLSSLTSPCAAYQPSLAEAIPARQAVGREVKCVG